MKRIVIAVFFFFGCITGFTQTNNDSCTMEISLLTCAPGTDLYSIFGHTAIRVRDARRGMDIVYNYGTFDDTDPLFYIHFTKGIMNYSLSAETYDSFMTEYEYERRAVMGQVLNLDCAEKNQLYEALRKNTLEENRFYQYRFHTDNCTTRAGRIIELNTKDSLRYENILPQPGPSYRDMIHEYLDPQHQDWSKFGIDMCLGMNLDVKPSNIQAIHFLPDYLYRGMDHATEGNKRMVAENQKLLSFPETKTSGICLRPWLFFECLFLALVIVFYFLGLPEIRRLCLIFDISFFSLMGLAGINRYLLWLETLWMLCAGITSIFYGHFLPIWWPYFLFAKKQPG